MSRKATMDGPPPLSTLSREQLISIAEIRGEAIVRFTQTVTEVREMALAGNLRPRDLERLYQWVELFMTEVIVTETMVGGGGWTPEHAR